MANYLNKFICLVGFLNVYFSEISALTVEEAYKSIPHQRTVFDSTSAKMQRKTAISLTRLFLIVDEGIVFRVQIAKDLALSNSNLALNLKNYRDFIKKNENEFFEEEIVEIYKLVISAMQDQYTVLANTKSTFIDTSNPLVRSASNKLHAAYNTLMAKFPTENAQNKQAFFDYLCALDFI